MTGRIIKPAKPPVKVPALGPLRPPVRRRYRIEVPIRDWAGNILYIDLDGGLAYGVIVELAQGAAVRCRYGVGWMRLGRGLARGRVTEFSRRSRRRLLEFLHRINWPRRILFVTLTFAEAVSHAEAKAELHRFLIWLGRRRPTWTLVWKLEFQRRGVHHYHILLIPDPDTRRIYFPKRSIDKAWRRGYTWIESVPQSQIAGYLAKYVGKPASSGGGSGDPNSLDYTAIFEQEAPGRYWGIRGPVYWAPVITTVPEHIKAEVQAKAEALLLWATERGILLRGCKWFLLREPVTFIPPRAGPGRLKRAA